MIFLNKTRQYHGYISSSKILRKEQTPIKYSFIHVINIFEQLSAFLDKLLKYIITCNFYNNSEMITSREVDLFKVIQLINSRMGPWTLVDLIPLSVTLNIMFYCLHNDF